MPIANPTRASSGRIFIVIPPLIKIRTVIDRKSHRKLADAFRELSLHGVRPHRYQIKIGMGIVTIGVSIRASSIEERQEKAAFWKVRTTQLEPGGYSGSSLRAIHTASMQLLLSVRSNSTTLEGFVPERTVVLALPISVESNVQNRGRRLAENAVIAYDYIFGRVAVNPFRSPICALPLVPPSFALAIAAISIADFVPSRNELNIWALKSPEAT
jgi:hypothetical protein